MAETCRLAGGRRTVAHGARGLLEPDEISLLQRSRRRTGDRTWARGDLPLLDEAEAVVSGATNAYGHVIIDEAQDLSAMELRALGRRSIAGSMTVLGDLAQATGIGAQENWNEVAAALSESAWVRLFELDVGYGVPEPIMTFANRLLPAAAPHVPAPRAIRLEGGEPHIVATSEEMLGLAAWEQAAEAVRRWPTVGVIVPNPLLSAVVAAFREHAHGAWRVGEMVRGVSVLPPELAKGLEFYALIVIEPAEIIGGERHGARMLYVALTRAVQELTIVHARPLPAELSRMTTPDDAGALL